MRTIVAAVALSVCLSVRHGHQLCQSRCRLRCGLESLGGPRKHIGLLGGDMDLPHAKEHFLGVIGLHGHPQNCPRSTFAILFAKDSSDS